MTEDDGPSLGLKPSDILGSLATLIGLLLTALGLLANAKLDPGTFTILATLIVAIMILFIITANLTALATWTRRTLFWNVAKAMFPISWSVFGLGVVAMLLAIAFGPGVFVIKLPQVNISVDILTTLIAAFAVAGSALATYVQYRSTKRELEIDLGSAQMSQQALTEARRDLEIEQDVKMVFLRRAIELEDLLRRIGRQREIPVDPRTSATQTAKELNVRGILPSDTLKRFIAIWDIRNKTVHGYDVPNSVARRSLELVEDLLDSLRTLMTTPG